MAEPSLQLARDGTIDCSASRDEYTPTPTVNSTTNLQALACHSSSSGKGFTSCLLHSRPHEPANFLRHQRRRRRQNLGSRKEQPSTLAQTMPHRA